MKLWILEAKTITTDDNPWRITSWPDHCVGFVIRAESEEDARTIATRNGKDEVKRIPSAWLDSKYSDCYELLQEGDEKIILSSNLT